MTGEFAFEQDATDEQDVGKAGGARYAMAKRLATDTGHSAADRALQPHGGHGCLSAYGIEKIVRDLRVHHILEGNNEIMRVIVARGLTEVVG